MTGCDSCPAGAAAADGVALKVVDEIFGKIGAASPLTCDSTPTSDSTVTGRLSTCSASDSARVVSAITYLPLLCTLSQVMWP